MVCRHCFNMCKYFVIYLLEKLLTTNLKFTVTLGMFISMNVPIYRSKQYTCKVLVMSHSGHIHVISFVTFNDQLTIYFKSSRNDNNERNASAFIRKQR